ncbi:hypothetical protein A9995_00870 [Erythrobacter sp. QSSC1-22B]|uniref:hypothetical protein n=1 Tax=Erythrobacter sp. QSSC1-22B TaxID=1860125 RepID=UPI0008060042|nr:hypothetical protein [Erythrobacter sp. QSSC1-22B]OBX20315.1 hypothetical protein A9995_00870 [Erythrobacter sp. QSSC1-22B]
MRIAILTALADDPDRKGRKRAFRIFAGRSILSHQLDCAIDLGCESVACLVGGLGQDVIACQHRAEAAGVRFQAIEDIRRLSGLVKADDDVFVIADGLLPSVDEAVRLLGERSVVLTFPADPALALGFERIDGDCAWSGMLRTRGQSVERLSDLPPDAEAASALLRIALQAGTRQAPLDPALLANGDWLLRADPPTLLAREKRWIAGKVSPVSFAAPGLATTERMGSRLARDIVGTRLERIPLFAAVGAGVLAALTAALGKPLVALSLGTVMAVLIPIAGVIQRLGRMPRNRTKRLGVDTTLRAGADLLLVGLIALNIPVEGPAWLRLFVPSMLFAMLWLGEQLDYGPPGGSAGWRALYADRIVLLILLLPAAFFGTAQLACAVLAALVLGSLFLRKAEESGLTAD